MEAKEDGSIEFNIPEVAPGGFATFNLTVVPKLYGLYESTRARIQYASSLIDSDEIGDKKGYSTSLGKVRIISSAEHKRLTSYNVKEWGIFGGIYFLFLVVPFFSWLNSSNKSNKNH